VGGAAPSAPPLAMPLPLIAFGGAVKMIRYLFCFDIPIFWLKNK